MAWKERERLVLEWSLIMSGLVALFWVTWSCVTGSIPTVTGIKMSPWWTVSLPFAISRGWDILMAFIGTVVIFRIFTNKQNKFSAGDDFIHILIALIFALAIGLGPGIIFGVAVGWILLIYLTIAPAPGTSTASIGTKSGLVLGLGFGLISGIAAGLLVFLLTGGLIIAFDLMLKILTPKHS